MITYKPDLPLFSIHIFKTAGNSLNKILGDWFGRGFIHQQYNPATMIAEKHRLHRRNWYFKSVPICVHGHFPRHVNMGLNDIYPEYHQCLTFIREPLELQLSAYHFTRKLFEEKKFYAHGELVTEYPYKDIDYYLANFDSFLLDDLPWEITFDNYESILNDKFVHVGITDNFERSVNILAEKLGKKPPTSIPVNNTTTRKYIPNQESVDAFKSRNQFVYDIYHYCKEMNK